MLYAMCLKWECEEKKVEEGHDVLEDSWEGKDSVVLLNSLIGLSRYLLLYGTRKCSSWYAHLWSVFRWFGPFAPSGFQRNHF